MVIASSTNLFILFWQASHVLWGHVMKKNLANWSFHIVKNGNLTKIVDITSRYTPVGRNFSKIIFFEVGWPVIWEKKYCSFFKVYYLISSKAQVSKFATLSWHLQIA